MPSDNPVGWFASVVSVAAFAVSLMGYRQKSREGRLAMRKQLTDILEKLTELNIEEQKSKGSGVPYPANYAGLLNDQRRFLTRQADYLISRIRDLVSPYEYLVVAGAFDGINDFEEAEHYFKLAIDAAPGAMDRGIAVRGFARYLFNSGRDRHAEARKYFQQAVDTFPDTNDRQLTYRADTYERWFNLEREWGNREEASKQLQRAITEYRRLSHPGRRKGELDRLSKTQTEWNAPTASPK